MSESNVIDLFQGDMFDYPDHDVLKPLPVRSMDEFSRFLADIKSNWEVIWYRGLDDQTHELLPPIFRRKQEYLNYLPMRRIDERHVTNRLKSRMPFYAQKHKDIVGRIRFDQAVCLAQHRGFPTRLLDWTESLGTALYFGLPHMDCAPCLWLLNPLKLNQLSKLEEAKGMDTIRRMPWRDTLLEMGQTEAAIWDSKDRQVSAFFDRSIKERSPKSKKYHIPRAIVPDFINERMVLQQSCFTIYADDDTCLKEMLSRFDRRIRDEIILGIEFTEDFCEAHLPELRDMCPSPLQVYGDLEGLFREILEDEVWSEDSD